MNQNITQNKKIQCYDLPEEVFVGNFLKIGLHLVALTNLVEIFRKGILSIDHRGPHHYFLCLLKLSNLTPFNALGDVSTTPDDHFKEMLKQSGEEEVLAVDDGPDVVAAEVG